MTGISRYKWEITKQLNEISEENEEKMWLVSVITGR